MPASHHGAINGQPSDHLTSAFRTHGNESSYGILQCVKDQESQLELLTRELEVERRNVVSQLERCTVQNSSSGDGDGSNEPNSTRVVGGDNGVGGMPRDLNQHNLRYGDIPHHHHHHSLHQSEEADDSSNYAWRLPADESGDYGGNAELQPLINRKVETTVNQKIERKETTASRRVLPDKGNNMPQYYPYSMPYYGGGGGEPQVQPQENNYSVNVTYRPMTSPSPSSGGIGSAGGGVVGGTVNNRPPNPANGYAVSNPDNPSPNSSQLSMHSVDVPGGGHPQLVSRTTTKNSTQQVTTVTKVIKSRELRHIGPDGQPLDFDPVTGVPYGSSHNLPPPPPSDYAPYGYGGGGIGTDPSARSDYGTYDSGRPPSPGAHDNPEHDFMNYGGRPHSPGSEASSRRNYDSYPSPHRSSNYNDYDPHLHPLPPQSSGRGPNSADYGIYHPRQDGAGGYPGGYTGGAVETGGGGGMRGEGGGTGTGGGGVAGGIPRQGNYGGGELLTSGADRPPTPPSPTSDASASPLPQRAAAIRSQGSVQGSPGTYPLSGYEELDNTLLMSGPPRNSDLYDTYDPQNGHYGMSPYLVDHHGQPAYADHFSPTLYEEDDAQPIPTGHDDRTQQQNTDIRWRDPDLSEVIDFLQHPNNIVKANAAAYLQHLCYSDDQVKQKARTLGGIPPLVALLNHDIPEVHRNACGALRNLSYGRQNDENKRAIKNANGIPSLVRLLRKTPDNEVRELVTGILWNLSSSEDLKKAIIDDGLIVLINTVIIPHSGWDRNIDASETPKPSEIYWSTVFRNASGVLRNVSSAGTYARCKLRECDGLVDALLYLVKAAIGKNDIDNKSVENCVCVLRNLSYRCQEVEDPNYDRHELQPQPRASSFPVKAGENLGCFGGSKKKKEAQNPEKQRKEGAASSSPRPRQEPVKGMELLWQPEVVQPYLSLLSDCSNPETLEAAAGAIQNLAACYWQPSIDIRAAVRKDKGLPILVELLRMEVDRVVCAVATALRNLALDQRNKELIGKYAMRDLVQKLPSEQQQHETGTSDETYAAVLATLNEVVRKSAEFSRSLLESSGVDRLMYITRQRGGRFSPKVVKFASQVLYNLWQHQEMREAYKKHGWKESNFVTRTMAARSLSPNNANSTLNRPMSSQGGTKYEDKTLQRPREPNPANVSAGAAAAASLRTPENSGYSRQHQPVPQMTMASEEVPLTDMPYPVESSHRPPVGGVQVFPPGIQQRSPNEPVYAQVNREKKKLRQYDGGDGGGNYDTHPRSYGHQTTATTSLSDVDPPPSWDYDRQQQQRLLAATSSSSSTVGLGGHPPPQQQQQQHAATDPDGQQGGDSWV